MKILNSLLLFFLILNINPVNAQFLFVDEENWLEQDQYISDYPQELALDKKTIAGDTLGITYKYGSGKKAIAGQYIATKSGKAIKIGTWSFFYPDGKKIQSMRSYNSAGALINVLTLKNLQKDSLDIGFPFQNRDKSYYGHQFRYDTNGELVKIVRYSKGFVVEEFATDRFELERLKRPEIRQYKISESEVLEELTFQEAVALLESDPKPIFMRITRNHMYTKRVTKTLAENPKVSKIIADNYHLVYIDAHSRDKISFSHNGEQLTFNGCSDLLSKLFDKRIRATPTYFLVSPDLELMGSMTGASKNAEKLEHQLKYFLEDHYEFMTYKEYNPEEE